MIWIERKQFDLPRGLPHQNLGHHLARHGLDHDTIPAPDRGGGLHHQNVAIAVERQHGIALHLQRVSPLARAGGKLDHLPAMADGKAGIVEEGKALMEEEFDGDTLDACLIGAGQRAEHYEMATYGTLVAWARAMGHDEAADLLQQNLDEEKAADEKLSSLAEGGINQSAADMAHGGDEGGEEERELVSTGRRNAKTTSGGRKNARRR